MNRPGTETTADGLRRCAEALLAESPERPFEDEPTVLPEGQRPLPPTDRPVAEEVAATQAEGGAQRAQLGLEQLHRPQRRVVWVVGAAAAQLVVEHHAAVARRLSKGFEVVVGRPGAAVDDDAVPGRRAQRDSPGA